MKVQDLMTREVKCCTAEASLAAAGGLMWQNDCGSVPVVDEQGKVKGMITDRDICIAVSTKGRPASQIPVTELLAHKNPTVYTCRPQDDVKEALKTMRTGKVRRLPVVNSEGTIQGILSVDDVVVYARKSNGKPLELSGDDVIEVLKFVNGHRVKGARPERDVISSVV